MTSGRSPCQINRGNPAHLNQTSGRNLHLYTGRNTGDTHAERRNRRSLVLFGSLAENRKRMGHRALLACILLIVFAGASSAVADDSHYVIDAGQSAVHFSLTGSHEVNGTFHIASGDISFDRVTGQMNGKIIVSAASGDSGDKSRDKKMKNDQLRVKAFPDIVFAPASYTGQIPGSGSARIQVKGTFTLIGRPHEVTVPMTVQIDGGHCTATGSFVIPYVQWGVKDPSIFILKVAKQVKIDLTLTGQIGPAA